MTLEGKLLHWFEHCGAISLMEHLLGRGGILAYHDVTSDVFLPSTHVSARTFAAQVEFLAESYRIVTLRELLTRRRAGRSVRGLVAITFDDAYRGIRDLALPILAQRSIPSTVFVATGFCDGVRRYWWDRVEWALQRAPADHQDTVRQSLAVAPGSSAADVLLTVIRGSRGAPSSRLEAALRSAEAVTGDVPERSMSAEELMAVAQSDLVTFGAHTQGHLALSYLPEADAEREIADSLHWLRNHLPRVEPYLAYPYGLYSRATVRAARRAGIEAAFSMEGRAAGPRFDMYTCPRIGIAEVNNCRGVRLRLAWGSIPLVAWRNGGWHPQGPDRLPAPDAPTGDS